MAEKRKHQTVDATRLDAFAIDPDELVLVNDPAHPLYERERLEAPLPPALVANIKHRGVLKPVLVRKNGERLEVIDGRRRVLCARVANKALVVEGLKPMLVPIIVRKGHDADLVAISGAAQMHEEESPLNKARRAQKLVDFGYAADQIAVELGVSERCVQDWTKLLEMSSAVQDAIERRDLTASAALKLAGLDHEAQVKALDKLTSPAAGSKGNGKPATAKEAAGVAGRAVKPGLRQVKKVADAMGHGQVAVALGWVLGEVSAEDLAASVPGARSGLVAAGLVKG